MAQICPQVTPRSKGGELHSGAFQTHPRTKRADLRYNQRRYNLFQDEILFLLTLIVISAPATYQALSALTQQKQAATSQIIVTRYTGTNAQHPKAEPIYRIVLKRNGNAIYVGGQTYMKRFGRYEGKVASSDFLRLSALFQGHNFQQKPSKTNHHANIKYEIVSDKGKQTIPIYEDYEPLPQFIKRANAIHYGLLWKIQWKKISDSDAISG